MGDLATLLDAPQKVERRIPIARTGEYHDKRYGDFGIHDTDRKQWAKNLSALPGGRALVDFDHKADKPGGLRNTEAAGWVTSIGQEDDLIYGNVDWTPTGEAAVRDGRYLFTSAVFGPHKNERGETFKNTLTGVSLTNKPFITSLPMVQLASDENIQRAMEDDPSVRLYLMALEGELGEQAQRIALASPEDETVTSAISAAATAVHKAIAAQQNDPDKADRNDQEVLRALRAAASRIDDAGAAQERDNKGEKPNGIMMDNESGDDDTTVELDQLTTEQRNNLKAGDFVYPEDRRYPIHDLAHARNALARVGQNGNPEEQAKVKATVYRRYPALKPAAKKEMEGTEDRRRQMEVTTDTLKALGITDEAKITEIVELASAEDADFAKVLEAIEAAKPESESKTLEELAKEQGVMVLSAEDHAALVAKAEAEVPVEQTKSLEELAKENGAALVSEERLTQLETTAAEVPKLQLAVEHLEGEAEESKKELAQQRFDTAYDEAERLGKAAPAQKERWEKFYTLDADGTLEALKEQPQLVGVTPRGRNISPAEESAPDNTAPERYALDQQVRSYMEENKGTDYMTALEAVAQSQGPVVYNERVAA